LKFNALNFKECFRFFRGFFLGFGTA